MASKFEEQKAEAAGGGFPTKVQFKGHTYKLLPQEQWTIDLLENLAKCEENPLTVVFVVQELLGNDYKSFKQRHNRAMAINEFFEQITKQVSNPN